MPDTAVVDVKSAWFSKINWTQAVGLLGMILTYFGIDMPPEVQAKVLALIGAIVTIATWIQRTWFTVAVTPASLQNK